jgi:hypothetical protein
LLNIEILTVITAKEYEKQFERLLTLDEHPLLLSIPGRGTAIQDWLVSLGLDSNEKTVFLRLGLYEELHNIMDLIDNLAFKFGAGSVFAALIPLSSVAAKPDGNLFDIKKIHKEEGFVLDNEYEMIVAIVAQGFSGLAMEYARIDGGAKGGTIIHAKGIGSDGVKKFFGISVSGEKDVILIACKKEDRKQIVQAVMNSQKEDARVKPITFSLPITEVAPARIFTEGD